MGYVFQLSHTYLPNNTKMESGFEDDFAPMQSSTGKTATIDDDSLILGDEDDSPKKTSDDAGDITNTGVVLDDPNSTASSDLSLSNSKTTEPREDPEVIKQWKENQIQLLQNKDQEEEKEKELLKEQAKKELEDWYKQHSEQLSKLQAANRAASVSYEQELELTTTKLVPGTEWERVAKLCDFNPKNAKNTKDISRMRSVILQLKQEGCSPLTPKSV